MKLQTCMNLFNKVAPGSIFQQVLDAFFRAIGIFALFQQLKLS